VVEANDQRLGHLLTYTTFHIGLYVSLIAALISAGLFAQMEHGLVKWAIACFLVAGICGGVVGSNIPDYPDFDAFNKARIGFWRIPIFKHQVWTTIEHLAFWVGIVPMTVGYLWYGKALFGR
jgi:hypothetical protein